MTHDDIMATASHYSEVDHTGYVRFTEDDLINFANAIIEARETSANVAQGAEAVVNALEETQGLLVAMLHEKRSTQEIEQQIGDNRTALQAFASASAAPPAQHKSDWHPDFVTALYDNADPDKRYTMDQMREYADAFHRSRLDAAITAAQSASGDKS